MHYNKYKDKQTTRYKKLMEDRPGYAKHQLMGANRSGGYNSAINKKIPRACIRVSDETWIKGRFKGKKIKHAGKPYIEWMLENREMPSSHKVLLRQTLKTMK
jgi:hypothetical protein|tara:strand:+ start:1377 stop:1682 length:306 start_codon:yes stop_codon:yes gene_type:complete